MESTSNKLKIDSIFYEMEDFDVCEINGSKFALFKKAIQSSDSLCLDLSDYNVVFLNPAQVRGNFFISAISVISLANFNLIEGSTEITAEEKSVVLINKIKSQFENKVKGNKAIFFCIVEDEAQNLIIEKFSRGIKDKDSQVIVNALIDTFEAISDSLKEGESYEVESALRFFNIPFDEQ